MEKGKMKAVLYKAQGEIGYAADVMDIPTPGPGQVLIKVEAAVINPSDMYMMQGKYNGEYTYPIVPGVEGSGTVVGYGGGFMAWMLMGKRVGFSRQAERGGKYSVNGAYAEYVVTNAMQCVTLDDDWSWEQGAGCFVNPLTAVGLLDKCQMHGARAVVQTGASSQLGRMIIKYFRENGMPLVNVVRRQEQVDMLKNEYGAEHVLNSESETFDADLERLVNQLNVSVCLEAVSGEMTGRIMQALPKKGVVIQYGLLSEKKVGPINPLKMIFKAYRLEGFLLPYWMNTKSYWAQWRATRAARGLIQHVTVNKCFGLHQIEEAIEFYKANMTSGKVYLKPSLTQ